MDLELHKLLMVKL